MKYMVAEVIRIAKTPVLNRGFPNYSLFIEAAFLGASLSSDVLGSTV
jgi:hypothetical protein